MRKFIAAFYMIMISAVIVAQSDYNQLTNDTRSYFENYANKQVITIFENQYTIPSATKGKSINYKEDMIRIGIPYPKEIKRINKKIEKRNKEIRKREKNREKQWEKQNKRARKEREKRNKEIRKQNERNRKQWEKENKKYKKRVERIGEWF